MSPNDAKSHGQPPVTFTLDGAEHTVDDRRQTAAAVLGLAGLDPADYDLLRVVGKGNEQRFRDQEVVELVPGGRYLSFFTGSTPVEQGAEVVGLDGFIVALAALGLKTERRGDLVVVEMEPPLGPAAGTKVEVGADPPGDYPRIPPHWVHLPARFELPGGNRTESELGPGWSKWSRPHKRWRGGPGAASEWLAHTRALLAAAADGA